MPSQAPADAEVVRRSIRERVRAAGDSLASASAVGMVAVLGGAALWPIVAPLLGGGVAVGMVSGGMRLLGGPGQEFVTRFLKRVVTGKEGEPAKTQAELERALLDRLQASDGEAAALRQEVSALLRSVDGVQAALAGASTEVQDALARGLADVSASWREFGWMLDQVERRLVEIADRQAYGLALQRESLDLQREQLVKTNLLLQRRRARPAETSPEPPPAEALCPYKGLEPFQPEDSDWFFGREALVAEGLARLSERGLVAVVGASGSGKSSFLRAGLVAGLWKGAPGGRVLVLTPGARPLEALALRIALQRGVAAGSLLADLRADPRRLELAARQALVDAPDGTQLTFVVDQLEELFTLCRDEGERRAFLEALLHAQAAPSSPTRLVMALRADFYGQLSAFSDLAGAVQDDHLLVGRMTAEELRRTIEEPAAAAGLTLEAGLAQTILEDLGDEPGALPLLSHALLETWKRRRGTTLTVGGYFEAGGVRGAIAQSAERVVADLDPRQRAIAREVFLNLTEVGEGSEPTRRPVVRDELAGPDRARVVNRLAEARLLTVDEEHVQVAHEALIRHWPTLQGWLEDERESLLTRRRLTQAAREWHALGREPGALYRGVRLAAARDWAGHHEAGRLEREFLDASTAAERSELETARRRTRRLRILATSLAAMVVAAGTSALLAVRAADRARDQQRASLSRSLATQALSDAAGNLDRAALLSLEAYRAKPTFEARDAVLSLLPLLDRSAGSLQSHTGAVEAVAFSPNGRTLASAGGETVRLWDLRTRRMRGPPLRGHTGGVRAVAFSRDGRRLASAGDDETVRLWDAGTGRQLGRPLTGHTDALTDVAFSPDGDALASAATDRTVRLWDVSARRQLGRPLTDHTGNVNAVAFSPDGRVLASAGDDDDVRIWDLRSRRRIGRRLVGHTGSVLSVAFSPDGTTLASSSTDNTVRLWHARERRPLRRPLEGHTDSVGGVAFSPDGRQLASASVDQTLRLWDVDTGRTIGQPLVGHTRAAVAVAFSLDGRTLASGSVDGAVRLWDTRRSLNRPLTRHTSWVASVAFSPDRRTLASGGFDDKVRLWDLRVGQPLDKPLTGHTDIVGGLAFSTDGRTLATASTDGAVGLWDMRTRRAVAGLAHPAAVRAVALSSDDRTLASAGADGMVRLWDVPTRRPLGRPLTGHELPVASVAFSPDGRILASAGEDATVRLWDVRTRRPLGPMRHPERVRAVAFSPDGRLLASAGFDRAVRLWDAQTHRPLGQPLAGHTGPVSALAFSPDGRTLASAGDSVRFWDVATRRSLGRGVSPGSGLIQSVAFSPDGTMLASGGLDAVVRVWSSILWSDDRSALRRHVCGIVNRSLSRAEWSNLVPGEPYRETCPRA